jgi:hypothetical protein
MVQISLNMIGGLLCSHTVNLSVMNLLAKQTHDCRSVGVSVAWMVVFLLPKEMRRGTAAGVVHKRGRDRLCMVGSSGRKMN